MGDSVRVYYDEPMHHPVKAGWEGSNAPVLPPRGVMRSCVRAIQASTGPITVSSDLPITARVQ